MSGYDYGKAIADGVMGLVFIALVLGIILGGVLFKVIPWLWRHVDLRWLP